MSDFPKIQWLHPDGGWPSFSTDGGQVVFTKGNTLYIINSDGTDLRRLYPAAGTSGVSATRPDWSWNPNAIAFARNGEIWTVHPDGSGAAPYFKGALPITANVIYPSWCKDLKSLVAVGYYEEAGAKQAVLLKLTPDTAEVLTKSPHPCAGRPSVNPEDTRIAFAGNWGEYQQEQNQIWIVEPLNEPFRLEPGDPSAFQGRSPNWSPDGDQIVFESTRPTPDPDTNTWLAIWVINSDGRGPWQLTDRTLFSATHAEWSRQQTRIVFQAKGKGIGIIDME
ncbi:MAG TPA: hypothetical protein VGS07_15410 [Thermoanaerobaculia bacterium]|jgi:Tol biopolymer transport system component|nr:hypothetical protein [Thermoanaerobaculia bacterium]